MPYPICFQGYVDKCMGSYFGKMGMAGNGMGKSWNLVQRPIFTHGRLVSSTTYSYNVMIKLYNNGVSYFNFSCSSAI